jgi:ribonucleoside-diphosphate reductase alpha chain
MLLLQKDWIRRAKKFSKNYFKNNTTQMIYCLKDVHLWHKWNTINREFKKVNFEEVLTTPKYKDVQDYAAQACAGGACEI